MWKKVHSATGMGEQFASILQITNLVEVNNSGVHSNLIIVIGMFSVITETCGGEWYMPS